MHTFAVWPVYIIFSYATASSETHMLPWKCHWQWWYMVDWLLHVCIIVAMGLASRLLHYSTFTKSVILWLLHATFTVDLVMHFKVLSICISYAIDAWCSIITVTEHKIGPITCHSLYSSYITVSVKLDVPWCVLLAIYFFSRDACTVFLRMWPLPGFLRQ